MFISDAQYDALREIINIGVGRAANTLNLMSGKHIVLTIPEIKLMSLLQLNEELTTKEDENLSSVNLDFKGNFAGSARLIFPTESASKLVATFTSEDDSDDDFDSIRAGTLSEIGNVVLNSLIGTISNMLDIHLSYSPPNYEESKISWMLNQESRDYERYNLFARTRFTIEALQITGDFLIFFEVGSLDELLKMVDKTFISN